jgi:hypothetical protein
MLGDLEAERRGRRGLGWDEKEGARWSAPASKDLGPCAVLKWVSSSLIGGRPRTLPPPKPLTG